MHTCACWVVRISDGGDIINVVRCGNVLWCRTGVVHFCSGWIVCERFRCSECDVVCGGVLPAVFRTDHMHCRRGWILCSGAGSGFFDALLCRVV